MIKGLLGWGTQIATTNYDGLIESVGGKQSITWADKVSVAEFVHHDRDDILHLHGHYRRPDSVVLDADDYRKICNSDDAQHVMRVFLMTRTLVFVGCGAGLDDPNFQQLFRWSREILERTPYSHYRLVPHNQLVQVETECRGLNVRPIPYGPQHDDLVTFLTDCEAYARTQRATATSNNQMLARGQARYLAMREQLDSQRTTLAAADYVRRSLEAARALRGFGGFYRAASDLSSIFRREEGKLSNGERVAFGMEVIEMLLDAHINREAGTVLQQIVSEVETVQMLPIDRERFVRLQIRCLNNLCAYDDTLAAIDRALPTACGDERARLQAQRAEIEFLQGNLENAVKSLGLGDDD